MAMQAEYPSDVLVWPETSWNRMGNLNGEQRNFISPPDINVDDPAPDFKMLPFAAPDGISNRLLHSYPFQSAMHGMPTCWPSHVAMPELNANMLMCNNNNKKRLRESDQPVNFVCLEGLKANSFNMPPKSSVSTGLRLSFEDLSNSTTRKEFNNNNTIFVNNNLAAEIQRQRDEMEQFMRLQEERMRQSLIEKTEKHSKVLICAAAAAVSRKLQEKDLQLVHMKHKNMELEERIKGLEVESLTWQNRARCSESVATALKLQIEERNKEGSGDSEEEAAIANAMANISSSSCQLIHSTTNNNNSIVRNIYKENRELEMQRNCRLCRSKEACILLLPCRHLCVCEHCDHKLDVCPLCSARKTASVQVYIT